MNYYRTSDGNKISKSIIDSRIRKAKAEKLNNMMIEYGYIFCEDCKKSSGDYLDCSHDISVDQCQKQGMSEKSWDIENITIRCRTNCHVKHDAKSRIN